MNRREMIASIKEKEAELKQQNTAVRKIDERLQEIVRMKDMALLVARRAEKNIQLFSENKIDEESLDKALQNANEAKEKLHTLKRSTVPFEEAKKECIDRIENIRGDLHVVKCNLWRDIFDEIRTKLQQNSREDIEKAFVAGKMSTGGIPMPGIFGCIFNDLWGNPNTCLGIGPSVKRQEEALEELKKSYL